MLRLGKGVTRCVAFSPDGRWLAAGGADGLVRVWDLADGATPPVLYNHGAAVHGVAFSPDGKRLVSTGAVPAGGQRNQLIFWDPFTGRQNLALPWPGAAVVLAPQFTACGRNLIACSPPPRRGADGAAVRWTLQGNRSRSADRRLGSGKNRAIYSAAVEPAGRLHVLGTGDALLVLTLRTLEDGLYVMQPGGPLRAMVFAPDGTRLACAAGNVVRLWRVKDWDGPELAGHTKPVQTVAFAPNGRVVVSGGRDGLHAGDRRERRGLSGRRPAPPGRRTRSRHR